MLRQLDNQVVFKKAFGDKFVLERFVKDILGIDFHPDIIEFEKSFEPKIGGIALELDIFAESTTERVIVEIQRIQYNYNFDRFLNYFIASIIEQQTSAKKYLIPKTVYGIIVMTAPYKIIDKRGTAVQDEVLLTTLNPKNLNGFERDIYGHQLVFLNPNYRDANTPQNYKDWLDLVYESIHNEDHPQINLANEGIKRATELIDNDNLTPEDRRDLLDWDDMEAKKASDIQDTLWKVAKKMKEKGKPIEEIMEFTDLTCEEIEAL